MGKKKQKPDCEMISNDQTEQKEGNKNPWLLYIAAENTIRPKLPRQIKMMYRAFKIKEGYRCGDCGHLYTVLNRGKRYFKCNLFGESHGPGTDWRKKWTACGQYTEESSRGLVFEKGEDE